MPDAAGGRLASPAARNGGGICIRRQPAQHITATAGRAQGAARACPAAALPRHSSRFSGAPVRVARPAATPKTILIKRVSTSARSALTPALSARRSRLAAGPAWLSHAREPARVRRRRRRACAHRPAYPIPAPCSVGTRGASAKMRAIPKGHRLERSGIASRECRRHRRHARSAA